MAVKLRKSVGRASIQKSRTSNTKKHKPKVKKNTNLDKNNFTLNIIDRLSQRIMKKEKETPRKSKRLSIEDLAMTPLAGHSIGVLDTPADLASMSGDLYAFDPEDPVCLRLDLSPIKKERTPKPRRGSKGAVLATEEGSRKRSSILALSHGSQTKRRKVDSPVPSPLVTKSRHTPSTGKTKQGIPAANTSTGPAGKTPKDKTPLGAKQGDKTGDRKSPKAGRVSSKKPGQKENNIPDVSKTGEKCPKSGAKDSKTPPQTVVNKGLVRTKSGKEQVTKRASETKPRRSTRALSVPPLADSGVFMTPEQAPSDASSPPTPIMTGTQTSTPSGIASCEPANAKSLTKKNGGLAKSGTTTDKTSSKSSVSKASSKAQTSKLSDKLSSKCALKNTISTAQTSTPAKKIPAKSTKPAIKGKSPTAAQTSTPSDKTRVSSKTSSNKAANSKSLSNPQPTSSMTLTPAPASPPPHAPAMDSPLLSPVERASPSYGLGVVLMASYEEIDRSLLRREDEDEEEEELYKPLDISKTYSGLGFGFFDKSIEKKPRKPRSKQKVNKRVSVSRYDEIAVQMNQEFDDLDENFELSVEA